MATSSSSAFDGLDPLKNATVLSDGADPSLSFFSQLTARSASSSNIQTSSGLLDAASTAPPPAVRAASPSSSQTSAFAALPPAASSLAQAASTPATTSTAASFDELDPLRKPAARPFSSSPQLLATMSGVPPSPVGPVSASTGALPTPVVGMPPSPLAVPPVASTPIPIARPSAMPAPPFSLSSSPSMPVVSPSFSQLSVASPPSLALSPLTGSMVPPSLGSSPPAALGILDASLQRPTALFPLGTSSSSSSQVPTALKTSSSDAAVSRGRSSSVSSTQQADVFVDLDPLRKSAFTSVVSAPVAAAAPPPSSSSPALPSTGAVQQQPPPSSLSMPSIVASSPSPIVAPSVSLSPSPAIGHALATPLMPASATPILSAPATILPTTTAAPATILPTTTAAPATILPTATAAPAAILPTATILPTPSVPATPAMLSTPATPTPTMLATPATPSLPVTATPTPTMLATPATPTPTLLPTATPTMLATPTTPTPAMLPTATPSLPATAAPTPTMLSTPATPTPAMLPTPLTPAAAPNKTGSSNLTASSSPPQPSAPVLARPPEFAAFRPDSSASTLRSFDELDPLRMSPSIRSLLAVRHQTASPVPDSSPAGPARPQLASLRDMCISRVIRTHYLSLVLICPTSRVPISVDDLLLLGLPAPEPALPRRVRLSDFFHLPPLPTSAVSAQRQQEAGQPSTPQDPSQQPAPAATPASVSVPVQQVAQQPSGADADASLESLAAAQAQRIAQAQVQAHAQAQSIAQLLTMAQQQGQAHAQALATVQTHIQALAQQPASPAQTQALSQAQAVAFSHTQGLTHAQAQVQSQSQALAQVQAHIQTLTQALAQTQTQLLAQTQTQSLAQTQTQSLAQTQTQSLAQTQMQIPNHDDTPTTLAEASVDDVHKVDVAVASQVDVFSPTEAMSLARSPLRGSAASSPAQSPPRSRKAEPSPEQEAMTRSLLKKVQSIVSSDDDKEPASPPTVADSERALFDLGLKELPLPPSAVSPQLERRELDTAASSSSSSSSSLGLPPSPLMRSRSPSRSARRERSRSHSVKPKRGRKATVGNLIPPPSPAGEEDGRASTLSLSGELDVAHAQTGKRVVRRLPLQGQAPQFSLEQKWEIKKMWTSPTFYRLTGTNGVSRECWMQSCGYFFSLSGMAGCLFSLIDVRDNTVFASRDLVASLHRMIEGTSEQKLNGAFVVYDSSRAGHINASQVTTVVEQLTQALELFGFREELLAPVRQSEKLLKTLIGDVDESAEAFGVSKSEYAERVTRYLATCLDGAQSLRLGLHRVVDHRGKSVLCVLPGHAHWLLQQHLFLGVPLAIQHALKWASRGVESADWTGYTHFDLRSGKIVASPEAMGTAVKSSPLEKQLQDGLRLTPAEATTLQRQQRSDGDWLFTDYAPHIFLKLREYFNIDSLDYAQSMSLANLCAGLLLGSWSNTLQPLHSTARSGAFIFRTPDQRYIVKGIRESECQFLFGTLLTPYYHYIVQCGADTLLPRFLGLYRLRHVGVADYYMLVMKNTFPRETAEEPIIAEQFDLKGSTTGRTSRAADGSAPAGGTLKDLDWGGRHMIVASGDLDFFLKRLNNDCRFLEANELLDYSLLIGVHPIQYPADPVLDALSGSWDAARWGGNRESFAVLVPPNTSFSELYFVGLIDILTRYDLLKMGEHTLKSIFINSDSISCVPPTHYRNRFQRFLSTIARCSTSARVLNPLRMAPASDVLSPTSTSGDDTEDDSDAPAAADHASAAGLRGSYTASMPVLPTMVVHSPSTSAPTSPSNSMSALPSPMHPALIGETELDADLGSPTRIAFEVSEPVVPDVEPFPVDILPAAHAMTVPSMPTLDDLDSELIFATKQIQS